MPALSQTSSSIWDYRAPWLLCHYFATWVSTTCYSVIVIEVALDAAIAQRFRKADPNGSNSCAFHGRRFISRLYYVRTGSNRIVVLDLV